MIVYRAHMNKIYKKQHTMLNELIERMVAHVLKEAEGELNLDASSEGADDLGDLSLDSGESDDAGIEGDSGGDLDAGTDAEASVDGATGAPGEAGGEGDAAGGEGDLEGDEGDLAGGDIGGGDFGGGGFGGFGGGGGSSGGGMAGDSEGGGMEGDSAEDAGATGEEGVGFDLEDDPVHASVELAKSMLDSTGDDQKILNSMKASIQKNFESFDEGLPVIQALWDTDHPVLKIVARKLLFFIKGE